MSFLCNKKVQQLARVASMTAPAGAISLTYKELIAVNGGCGGTFSGYPGKTAGRSSYSSTSRSSSSASSCSRSYSGGSTRTVGAASSSSASSCGRSYSSSTKTSGTLYSSSANCNGGKMVIPTPAVNRTCNGSSEPATIRVVIAPNCNGGRVAYVPNPAYTAAHCNRSYTSGTTISTVQVTKPEEANAPEGLVSLTEAETSIEEKPFVPETITWGQITSEYADSLTQQVYKGTKRDNAMYGKTDNEDNLFSLYGCKETGTAKITSEISGKNVTLLDINKFDANKDGELSHEEVTAAIKKYLPKGKSLETNVYRGQESIEAKIKELGSSGTKGTTYILAEVTGVGGEGKKHWVVPEGCTTNERGQYVFDYSPTSNGDTSKNGRQYVLGLIGQDQENTFQVTKLETYTIY